jgi:hypothetical protein
MIPNFNPSPCSQRPAKSRLPSLSSPSALLSRSIFSCRSVPACHPERSSRFLRAEPRDRAPSAARWEPNLASPHVLGFARVRPCAPKAGRDPSAEPALSIAEGVGMTELAWSEVLTTRKSTVSSAGRVAHGSATHPCADENPVSPPDQGEVRWGWFESSILGADTRGGAGRNLSSACQTVR